MKTEDKRQRLIRDALARRDGDEAGTVTGLALLRWTQLAVKLTPLIGEGGFCALYARSLHLANPQFAWITLAESGSSKDMLFQTLRADLDGTDTDSASKGNLALTETFTGLLSKLIGDMLTERILIAAWSDESSGMNSKEVRK